MPEISEGSDAPSYRRLVLAVAGALLLTLCAPAGALAAAAPVIVEASVLDASSSEVTFQGQINPGELSTTYSFEYGLTTAYGASVPVPAGVAGAGANVATIEAQASGLSPGAEYHYRLVASNGLGTVRGEDHTFTTQQSGGEPSLPDNRAWEMVSPPQKQGAAVEPPPGGGEGGVVQAAANGDAVTYFSTTPIVEDPANNDQFLAQVLSRRGAEGGWSSEDIATPNATPVGASIGEGKEYRFFTPDLSEALVEQFNLDTEPPPLSPEVTERTDYIRDDLSGSYLPLVTPANTPPGTKIARPLESGEFPFESPFLLRTFIDATPDLSHVVLASHEALTPGAKKVGGQWGSLYEWTAGKLALVSVLPDEEQDLNGETFLGSQSRNMRNAISNDGVRVIWSDEEGSEKPLYMRNMTTGKTGELDLAQKIGEPSEHRAVFQVASTDGSRVFFTDDQKLTADSTAAPNEQEDDLYVCEVAEEAGRPRCDLKDLTGGGTEPAGVQAGAQHVVLGASEDGSYVYFVAKGKLTTAQNEAGEEAVAGGYNLYMEHYDTRTREWSRVFVATLSGEDVNDWGGSYSSYSLVEMTSRVSPNGEFLAFMSDRSLTGYDSRDAVSEAADEEVFLYDANSNRLVCASCNPSGARPHGILDEGREGGSGYLMDYGDVWSDRWLSASIPSWGGFALERSTYQSRFLSNAGRLFFDSADPLVPEATNGTADVYEYEPAGVGSCAEAGDTFSARSGGCVGLISSGGSRDESGFLDAGAAGPGGEEGEDVFFMTDAQLVGEDTDHSYDVYDAHVCSTASPCLAPSPALPPTCATTTACEPPPTPQPSVFGAPSSETFYGAGNRASGLAAGKPPVTARKRTRSQRLAAALSACRRGPRRERRACETRARARYAPPKAGHRAKRKRSAKTNRGGR